MPPVDDSTPEAVSSGETGVPHGTSTWMDVLSPYVNSPLSQLSRNPVQSQGLGLSLNKDNIGWGEIASHTAVVNEPTTATYHASPSQASFSAYPACYPEIEVPLGYEGTDMNICSSPSEMSDHSVDHPRMEVFPRSNTRENMTSPDVTVMDAPLPLGQIADHDVDHTETEASLGHHGTFDTAVSPVVTVSNPLQTTPSAQSVMGREESLGSGVGTSMSSPYPTADNEPLSPAQPPADSILFYPETQTPLDYGARSSDMTSTYPVSVDAPSSQAPLSGSPEQQRPLENGTGTDTSSTHPGRIAMTASFSYLSPHSAYYPETPLERPLGYVDARTGTDMSGTPTELTGTTWYPAASSEPPSPDPERSHASDRPDHGSERP